MNEDASEKSFDPTPRKLEEARKRGEIPRSVDLFTAFAYAGLTVAFLLFGYDMIIDAGSVLKHIFESSNELSQNIFISEFFHVPLGTILLKTIIALLPIFLLPALFVIFAIFIQRAFLFSPSKLTPKLSRISIIKNAGNKFGRNGLFEFAKSFVKLIIYSTLLAIFISFKSDEIIGTVQASPGAAVALLAELSLTFLFVVVCISGVIGFVDSIWQHSEHIRKNRMTRKEVTDETKETEGNPYVKQERRNRAQTIAAAQMMSSVPDAEVIIVNPTHYAVALAWSRDQGSAPHCVAKGTDAIALKIREVAMENSVPIHSDPSTARALYASVEIGSEISVEYYQAVAAAIRFSDNIREQAKARVY